MASRMTGGEALVKSLRREGVTVVFGLPGVQLYGAIAALRDEPGIGLLSTRHEQATAYMADGYARAGGRFGTALVVPGPGLLNTGAALSTAYAASSPVLLVAGQVPRASIGRNVGALHEVEDQLGAIRTVTKWRRSVLEVADIPRAVHEAVDQLLTGRPRPVALELPWDTLEEEAEVELVDAVHAARAAAPDAEIDRAARLLLAARHPAIYAGGGVHLSGAHAALVAVARHLQAGVIESPEGKGALSDRDDLALGAALWPGTPLRGYLDAADVVLAVGTRLAQAALGAEHSVIQIDVDGQEIGRNHAKTLGLEGDARATLERLLERLRAESGPRASRKAEHETLRAAAAGSAVQEPQISIIRSLRAAMPDDAILVAGMTQIGYYSRPAFPVYAPRTYLTSSYSGNLGYAYPTALGAKVACPRQAVVSVSGDGGFLYNVGELATAAQYGINVVAVVFNDGSYGNVARDLDEAWGGSYEADLRNPDFMRLAEAFGVAGLRAKDVAELGEVVRRAIEMDAPVLVEMPVGRMPRPVVFAPRRTPRRYQR